MADAILASSGIYTITNKVNGKKYIGSAVNVGRRFSDHLKRLRKNEHHSIALQNAWNKYGEAEFIFAVVEIVSDKNMLIEREQEWIDTSKAYGRGYNISPTAGSPLGVKHTDQARRNMRDSALMREPNPDRMEKMRLAVLGKKQTPSHIAKRLLTNLGKKRSPEFIEKMRTVRPDWKPTKEHADILRSSRLGKKNSPESIEKQKATKAAKKLAKQTCA